MFTVYFVNPLSGLKDYHYEIPLNISQLISCIKDSDFISKIEVFDFELNGYQEDLISFVNDDEETIFCIPIFTYSFEETIKICRVIKTFKENVKIIVGGPHATLDGENILRNYNDIDYILQGECDYTLLELLKALYEGSPLSRIQGLIYKNSSGVIVKNKKTERIDNLDDLPRQTDGFKYFDLEKIKSRIGFVPYIASRGCCFNCIFCSSSNLWGGKLKFLSPSVVIRELEKIKSLGFNCINFRDDFFTMNHKWLEKLLVGLKELDISWGCETRIDFIDKELLIKIRDGGCKLLRFGIETFNQKSLELIGKKFKASDAIKNLNDALELGFEEIRSSFLVGIPGETIGDIYNTLSICRKLKPMKSRFFALTPVLGTKLYNNMDSYGIRFVRMNYNVIYSNIETNLLTNQQINTLIGEIYDEFINPLDYYHRDFSDISIK